MHNTHPSGGVRLGSLGAASVLMAALLGLLAAPLSAQPNPFEAHEDSRREVAPQEPVEVQKDEPEAKPEAPSYDLGRQGQWSLGVGTLFSYTTTTNGVPEGGQINNETLFFRAAPSVGYFVIDDLEVSLSVGLLSRQLDRGGNEVAVENNALVEVSGRYFLSLTEPFSLYLDLGVGGYFGTSDRVLELALAEDEDPTSINERTDTSGLILSATLGAGYALSPSLQLRAGLGFTGLIGSESIVSVSRDLDVKTFNTGLTMGLFYIF